MDTKESSFWIDGEPFDATDAEAVIAHVRTRIPILQSERRRNGKEPITQVDIAETIIILRVDGDDVEDP